MFAKNVFEFQLLIVKERSLSFVKPFFPFKYPTFLCNWLNTAICIIVIFFCFLRGLLSGKVNYKALLKCTFVCDVQFSNPLSLSYISKLRIQNLLTPEPRLTCFPKTPPKNNFLSLDSSNNVGAISPEFINDLKQRHFSFSFGLTIRFFSWNQGFPHSGAMC